MYKYVIRIRHIYRIRTEVCDKIVLGLNFVIKRFVKRGTVPSFTKLFYNMSYLML